MGGGKILPWRNAITECNEYFCEEINCNVEVSFFDSCNYLPEIKTSYSSFSSIICDQLGYCCGDVLWLENCTHCTYIKNVKRNRERERGR